jgi:hypothetical protein
VSLSTLFDSGHSERTCSFVMRSCKLVNVKMLKRKCVFSGTVNEEYSFLKSTDMDHAYCYSTFMIFTEDATMLGDHLQAK